MLNLVGESVQHSGGTVFNIVGESVLLCPGEFDGPEDSVFDGFGVREDASVALVRMRMGPDPIVGSETAHRE